MKREDVRRIYDTAKKNGCRFMVAQVLRFWREYEVLKNAISVDEGASYFGEVALVPYDSPISQSGVLFLNTLFDENASCHFAFGSAYPCIYGSENMSEEQLKELYRQQKITRECGFHGGDP